MKIVLIDAINPQSCMLWFLIDTVPTWRQFDSPEDAMCFVVNNNKARAAETPKPEAIQVYSCEWCSRHDYYELAARCGGFIRVVKYPDAGPQVKQLHDWMTEYWSGKQAATVCGVPSCTEPATHAGEMCTPHLCTKHYQEEQAWISNYLWDQVEEQDAQRRSAAYQQWLDDQLAPDDGDVSV